MTLSAVLAAAVVAAGVGAAVGTGLSLEEASPQDAKVEATGQSGLDRRVSMAFSDAPLTDVLARLSQEGLSFVADSSSFSPSARLTISIQDKPLKAVMDAIADVFNAKWSEKDGVYILKRIWASPNMGLTETLPQDFWESLPKMEGDLDLKDFMKRFFGDEVFKFEGWRFMPKMDQEFDFKGYLKQFEDLKLMPGDEKAFEKLRESLKDREFRFSFGGMNLKPLMDSLTDDQWAKHQSQGYLTLDDLTDAQKKLVGKLPSGDAWSITLSIDGRSLTLRSSK